MNLHTAHERALIRWKGAKARKKHSAHLFAEQHKIVARILRDEVRKEKRRAGTGRDNRQLELVA